MDRLGRLIHRCGLYRLRAGSSTGGLRLCLWRRLNRRNYRSIGLRLRLWGWLGRLGCLNRLILQCGLCPARLDGRGSGYGVGGIWGRGFRHEADTRHIMTVIGFRGKLRIRR